MVCTKKTTPAYFKKLQCSSTSISWESFIVILKYNLALGVIILNCILVYFSFFMQTLLCHKVCNRLFKAVDGKFKHGENLAYH